MYSAALCFTQDHAQQFCRGMPGEVCHALAVFKEESALSYDVSHPLRPTETQGQLVGTM